MDVPKVGFIGCGAMGSALIKGMLQQKALTPSNTIIYDKEVEKIHVLQREFNIKAVSRAEEVCENAKYLFVVVKPQDFESLLSEIKEKISTTHVLVSVVAGISCNYIEKRLNRPAKVVRLMPNTPCLIGEGMIAISAGRYAGSAELEFVKRLVAAVGRVTVVKDNLMDAVTGLSGSGPAYIYMVIEALADGGVEAGLPHNVALELAAQTVKGAAEMVLKTGEHPAKLKNMVTSPGGTTSAGLVVLEETRLRSSLINAVVAATRRARGMVQ